MAPRIPIWRILANSTVSVLVPVAVSAPYSYAVPDGIPVAPGDIVEVPLGTRDVVGVVWDDPPDNEIGHNRLRVIVGKFDAPPLSKEIRAFVDWVADYTHDHARHGAPHGAPRARRARAGSAGHRRPSRRSRARPHDAGAAARPRARRRRPRLVEVRPRRRGRRRAERRRGARRGGDARRGRSMPAAPRGAAARPRLRRARCSPPSRRRPLGSSARPRPPAAIRSRSSTASPARARPRSISRRSPRRSESGRQVLILLPEIALTAGFLDRFAARFGVAAGRVAFRGGAAQRERVWRGVADGAVRVVVGARSALFLPFAELGLDRRRRGARPRLQAGGWRHLPCPRHGGGARPSRRLPGRPLLGDAVGRVARQCRRRPLPPHRPLRPLRRGAGFPRSRAIDLRKHPPERGRFLSPPLVAAVAETLGEGQQALLFLNRRGYAPLTLCRTCGHRFQCPNCSTWLVEHRFRGVLVCHHCGHEEKRPDACPNCGDAESLVAGRPGRRAARRGGRGALSRRAHHPHVERHDRRRAAACARSSPRSRRARSTSSSARSSSPRATTFRA